MSKTFRTELTVSDSLNSIIASIQDSHQARIKFALAGGNHTHCDCVFKEETPPHFFLVFPPDGLPEAIDHSSVHPLSILQDANIPSLSCSVVEQKDDRTLYMKANGTLDPASLREYFRVNTTTDITASHKTTLASGSTTGWTISGQTQDLSASGVLALLTEEPKNRDNIILEIYLPDSNTTVNAVSHVVRKKRLRSRRWQVSFHFASISSKHRDAILKYLLSEQRRQLRENIRTRDLT